MTEPLLQRPFHVRVGPRGIAVAWMLHRLTQEPNLVLGCREKLFVESAQVEVGNVRERHGKTLVERLREPALGEIGLDEPDELAGECRLLVRGFPLRGGEFIGREVGDVGESAHALLGTIKAWLAPDRESSLILQGGLEAEITVICRGE